LMTRSGCRPWLGTRSSTFVTYVFTEYLFLVVIST
jgi:hypothetical protein